MATLLAVIFLGFVLGMRHATDPDHVIAVTTIVSRERTVRHAVVIGVLWGLGHTVTILAVGSAIILLKLSISPTVGLAMELSVAFVLILLGLSNLTGVASRALNWFAIRWQGPGMHSHFICGQFIVHTHDPYSEPMRLEAQSSPGGVLRGWGTLGLFQILRPLAVGIVHGLAGSAAVTLLVLTTISRPGWAIAYLLIFGLGTIAGMMLITATIALPFAYTVRNFAQLNRGLVVASGVMSLSFGVFLCYRIGFLDGLFTAHASWIPR